MLSRRGFLLSSAGVITSVFLHRLYAHIERHQAPLLLDPPNIANTLYVSKDDQGLIALGSPIVTVPRQPTLTWLQFAAFRGCVTTDPTQLNEFLDAWYIEPDDLSKPMDGGAFEDTWTLQIGPAAKAFALLSKLDLGPEFRRSSKQAGSIELIEGGHPGDNSVWAEVHDPLSISLLQARLIELKLPLKVEIAEFS